MRLRTASIGPGDTQPVKTHPVRVAPPPANPSDMELGLLIFAYRPHPGSRAFKWIWGLGGLLVSLAALSYGGFLAIVTNERYGPVPALSRSAPWLILGGAALFIWWVVSIIRQVRTQPVVRLHANGLYIEGRRKRSLTWDQIDGIAQGITESSHTMPQDVTYHARLYPSQGRSIYLHGTGDGKRGMPYLPELISRIKASVYPHLQIERTRMFREGLPLHFGPIQIDRQCLKIRGLGLVAGTLSVPWEHVKRISVQSGYFLVESIDRRSPYRMPVSKIPNLEILLKIIDQCV